MAGRKPDYRLKALNKETGAKNNDVGAGWENEDKSISIVLNPCILLDGDKNMVYTLFPVDGK